MLPSPCVPNTPAAEGAQNMLVSWTDEYTKQKENLMPPEGLLPAQGHRELGMRDLAGSSLQCRARSQVLSASPLQLSPLGLQSSP